MTIFCLNPLRSTTAPHSPGSVNKAFILSRISTKEDINRVLKTLLKNNCGFLWGIVGNYVILKRII